MNMQQKMIGQQRQQLTDRVVEQRTVDDESGIAKVADLSKVFVHLFPTFFQ